MQPQNETMTREPDRRTLSRMWKETEGWIAWALFLFIVGYVIWHEFLLDGALL